MIAKATKTLKKREHELQNKSEREQEREKEKTKIVIKGANYKLKLWLLLLYAVLRYVFICASACVCVSAHKSVYCTFYWMPQSSVYLGLHIDEYRVKLSRVIAFTCRYVQYILYILHFSVRKRYNVYNKIETHLIIFHTLYIVLISYLMALKKNKIVSINCCFLNDWNVHVKIMLVFKV